MDSNNNSTQKWVPGEKIRVKAFIILPNEDRTAHAVCLMNPSEENPKGFTRLIGGSVEVGETHEAAIRREMDEELGATLEDLRYLGVVENIFTYNGAIGHEIVFMYEGKPVPAIPAENPTLQEIDGIVYNLVWRPFDDENEELPLYPTTAHDMIQSCRFEH